MDMLANVACPPSPENPDIPFPATVEMIPSPDIFLILFLSSPKYMLPKLSPVICCGNT